MGIYAQFGINVLATAALWLSVALGLALTLWTSRFLNFAQGALFAWSAYSLLLFDRITPLLVAFPLAMISTVLLAVSLEKVVYAPMRKRAAAPLVLMLSSLGLYTLLTNIISLTFGDEVRTVRRQIFQDSVLFCGAVVTLPRVVLICAALFLVVIIWIVLRLTRMGKAIRAIAIDADLAECCGLNAEGHRLFVAITSSFLAAVAGILYAVDVDIYPAMGMRTMMFAFVVVLVARNASIGALVGASVVVSASMHAGAWVIGSQWQECCAFGILVLSLLISQPRNAWERHLQVK